MSSACQHEEVWLIQVQTGAEESRYMCFDAPSVQHRPSLLLADEPTENLDSRTGEEILGLIRELSLSLGMTVVMVTHERALAERFAQRLVFLGDGKLLSQEVMA